MKKKAYTLIAMIVFVGALAVAAHAQTNSRIALIANIPFQFNIGNKTLPAGDYIVRSISDDYSTVVLRIETRDGRTNAMRNAGKCPRYVWPRLFACRESPYYEVD